MELLRHTELPRAKHLAKGSRQRILDAAEILFVQKGFRGTTLRDIALASGENSALVSYYFGSKDGLIEAVWERKGFEIKKLLESFSAVNPRNLPEMRKLTREYLARMRQQETFHRLVMRSLVEEEGESIAQLLWKPLLAKMSELIDNATLHTLNPQQLEARAFCFFGLVHQYSRLKWFQLPLMNQGNDDAVLSAYEDFFVEEVLKTLLSPNS